jgi:hypothetical protein
MIPKYKHLSLEIEIMFFIDLMEGSGPIWAIKLSETLNSWETILLKMVTGRVLPPHPYY